MLLNVVHYNNDERTCCCVSAAPHLHCVSWPHPNTGRSPARPIAVVVYLIRPNRGLTAVLLGKSTTTTNGLGHEGGFLSRHNALLTPLKLLFVGAKYEFDTTPVDGDNQLVREVS